MTWFGIYLTIFFVFIFCTNVFMAGRATLASKAGGSSARVFLFGALWTALNLLGILFIGTGVGPF